MEPRLLILHTGGTLGMRPREPDHALAPEEFGTTVLEYVPELARLAEVHTRVLCNLDSSDLTPEHWMALAQVIADSARDYRGIVITHGTDAMAYTASALSFVLRDLPLPVILTGSQRPLADVRSDAKGNLIAAADLALRDIPEVAIYFGGKLLRGNRATKSSTFAYGAYVSPNFPVLAEVGAGVKIVTEPIRPTGRLRVEGEFDPRVAVHRLLPGDSGEVLRAVADGNARAVLLEAFGSGNIPVADPSIANALTALARANKVVAVCSQASHGSVDLTVYAGGRRARDLGAVGTRDMTSEAAAVKLMYLLGTFHDPGEVRSRLPAPIAGEITPG